MKIIHVKNKEQSMEDQNALKAAEARVRGLIRSGMKTSKIISDTGLPVDFIKRIKSEELENDKKAERAAADARLQSATDAKNRKRDEAWLSQFDLTKPENDASTQTEGPGIGADVTVQAPAQGADAS